VDGTVGAGGHSSKILPRIQPEGRLIGLDRDPMMLAFAKEKLASVSGTALAAGPLYDESSAVSDRGLAPCRSQPYSLIHSSYVDLKEVLKSQGLSQIDRLLVDLGLSSDQLSDRERGFGFDAGGPLDMRFDTRGGISAAEFLRTAPVEEITRVFRDWGEEPAADKIAQEFVAIMMLFAFFSD
jgi:16S rRNA (cytosine1402-N4)-methyltransferase